jgi:uncharacterized damage-inducible protein DinB
MFAENARLRPSRYPGHGPELADGYEAVLQYLNTCHSESVDIFVKLSDKGLQSKCNTPAGVSITVWKWLRAMVEHEIHPKSDAGIGMRLDRGQIYMMLGILGVDTPPLYGLTAEEVLSKSQNRIP